MGRIRLCESARPSILIAKFDPLGKATTSRDPSSETAREDCSSAPRDAWAAVTRLTTSAHLRCSSPASLTAGFDEAAAAATSAAEGADARDPVAAGADPSPCGAVRPSGAFAWEARARGAAAAVYASFGRSPADAGAAGCGADAGAVSAGVDAAGRASGAGAP